MRVLIGLILSVFVFPAAHANEVYSCGVPDYELVSPTDEESHAVCDIYTRQIQYRDEHIEFKESMIERQENFAKVRRIALENYRRQLDALYGYE